MDHILNSRENRKRGTLRAKETKQGRGYLYALHVRTRKRWGKKIKWNKHNLKKSVFREATTLIGEPNLGWFILYSKLDDVKRERVVFSTSCLCSRRSRAQLRQSVVLLSVKNNETESGKKKVICKLNSEVPQAWFLIAELIWINDKRLTSMNPTSRQN